MLSTYQNINMSYIKNKDGITTNPMIGAHAKIDVNNNSLVDITYSVTAFDNPKTHGYHKKYDYKTFNEALEDYHKICTDSSHLDSNYDGKEKILNELN